MGLTQNNSIFYYAPLHTIGGFNEIPTAISILQKYDQCVVGVHTGWDLTLLNYIIQGVKEIKPNWKIYGYVPFGSTGSGVSATAIDQWIIDSPPSSGLLDGIFLDEFGHDFPSGTRAQQNATVQYCHDNSLPAFANGWIVTDYFGSVPNNANNEAAVLGSNPAIKDVVLIESFVTTTDATDPVTESNWVRDMGRLSYLTEQRDTQNKNIHICCMMGAGSGTVEDIGEDIWTKTLFAINEQNTNFLCVNHGDIAATWHTYFRSHKRNPFNTNMVIPSGTPIETDIYPR